MSSFQVLRCPKAWRHRLLTLSGASLLCLTLLEMPAGAQSFTEGSASSTSPSTADIVDIEKVTAPRRSASYFLSTYRSLLRAPLPARIWNQGGIPRIIGTDERFRNRSGWLGNYNQPGPTVTANNAFFQSLGTNGRSCVTCHNPPSAMGLALTNIKRRFRTNLNDPLFAPVDGANCPDAVPAQYTSGSLSGGFRGRGRKGLKSAYSLLLTRGLIRIPIRVPADAEYDVEVLRDRPGCNLNETYNQDPVTGEQVLSLYRRPIMSASLRLKVPTDDEERPKSNVMWDGREPNLFTQATSATLGHAQALSPPTQAQLQQMVDFETKFFSAQIIDKRAGRLDADGAEGGPRNLSAVPTLPRPVGPLQDPPFDEYDSWDGLTGRGKARQQASIARGQALFNQVGRMQARNINGLPTGNPPVFPVGCPTCHGRPHGGSEVFFPPDSDIGTGGQAAPGRFRGDLAIAEEGAVGPRPSSALPIFKVTCKGGASHPYYGTEIITNDPGVGLITGKCEDIGMRMSPALRGLAARAPYFSDGSAKDLRAVVNFYNTRFQMNLTRQEKADLVNFLSAL